MAALAKNILLASPVIAKIVGRPQSRRVTRLEPIAHHLEEGQLQSALDCSWRIGHHLWEVPCIRVPEAPDRPLRPSELYPLTSTPNWTFDTGLSEALAERYAMRQPERFVGKYMALRPDFQIETSDFLVFLEAKAGSRKALSRTWGMPKEVTY